MMMIGDGDGGGLVVGWWWWSVVGPVGGGVMPPPRAPRTMPVSPFAPKLVTDAILDSFKYYNFWLAKMSVRGFFLNKSRTKRSRTVFYLEDLCPSTGFEGFIFLDCAQVSYEMLITSFGVSKKCPCAGFWC